MHVLLSPDRQVRRSECTVSSTSAGTFILLTCSQCSSPCFTLPVCCYWNKVGCVRQHWYSSQSYLSVSGHKVLQLQQPSNSLEWDASSELHFSSFYCHQQLSVNSNFILHSCTFLYIMDGIFIPRHSVILEQARINCTCPKRESKGRKMQ